MVKFNINNVYKYSNSKDEGIRIIDINIPDRQVIVVKTHTKFCVPIAMSFEDFTTQIDTGIIEKTKDKYSKYVSTSNIDKKVINKRKNLYLVISQHWGDPDTKHLLIYSKRKRAEFIKTCAMYNYVSAIAMRRYFTLFWQRGMGLNSLMPDYSFCGNPGKDRKLTVGKPPGPKAEGSRISIAVTKDVLEIFKKAINEYYRKGTGLKSISHTFNMMIVDNYTYKLIDENGVEHTTVALERPSYSQFRYWFYKILTTDEIILAQKGKIKANTQNKAIHGSISTEVDGPGKMYHVDANTMDLYILNEDKTAIMERPTLYAAVDVFSRLITAIAIILRNPSWSAATSLIVNMIKDKSEYAKEFDLIIDPFEWPSRHLPQSILADRGEFLGENATNLTNLRIDVMNTASYSPFFKPLVERWYRKVNDEMKKFAKSAVIKDRAGRGEKDPKDYASLNLKELTRICIETVLWHNVSEIDKYEPTPEMVNEGVLPIPVELWNWGIENNLTYLQEPDNPDYVLLNLLPRKEVSETVNGIVLGHVKYASQNTTERKYFAKNRKIVIAYDENTTNEIYIPDDLNQTFEVCKLAPASEKYRNMSHKEVDELFNKKNTLRAERAQQFEGRKAQHNKKLKEMFDSAEVTADNDIKSTKKKIKENTSKERKRTANPLLDKNKGQNANYKQDDKNIPQFNESNSRVDEIRKAKELKYGKSNNNTNRE